MTRTQAVCAAAGATALCLCACVRLRRSAVSAVAGTAYCASAPRDGEIAAFSLRQAERLVRAGHMPAAVRSLGGITRPMAVVCGPNHEVILVGRLDKSCAALTIDDLSVALRSAADQNWPLVSIEPNARDRRTAEQTIVYVGGVRDTAYGSTLIRSDIVLKRAALALLDAAPRTLTSYFALCRTAAERRGELPRLSTRWWFEAKGTAYTLRDGVCVIAPVAIGLRTEATGSDRRRKRRDPEAEVFAAQMLGHLGRLSVQHPELPRMRALFDCTLLAAGAAELAERDLSFWTKTYRVARVPTPGHYPVLEKSEPVTVGGAPTVLSIHGGVRLAPLIRRLEAGEAGALKAICLAARPSSAALVWRVPHGGWTNDPHMRPTTAGTPPQPEPETLGCMLERRLGGAGLFEPWARPVPPVPARILEGVRAVQGAIGAGIVPLAPGGRAGTVDRKAGTVSPPRLGGVLYFGGEPVSAGKGGADLRDAVLAARRSRGDALYSKTDAQKGTGR